MLLSIPQIETVIENESVLHKEYFCYSYNKESELTKQEQFYEDVVKNYIDNKILVLMINNNCTYNEAYDDLDTNYEVYTEEEAEDAVIEYIEYIAEEAKNELPKHLQQYFNEEDYIEDLRCNSYYAEILSPYGDESIVTIGDETYCIYRI